MCAAALPLPPPLWRRYPLLLVALVPLERLLIETDSPYLAPVPYRGKTNNPSYVPWVAQQVASVRGMAVQDVAYITSRNFDTLFSGVLA